MTNITPDTEWEKELKRFGLNYMVTTSYGATDTVFNMEDEIKKFIQTLIHSRDTYWKERVEELIEKTIQEERFSGAPYALNKLKETITNKDNLK